MQHVDWSLEFVEPIKPSDSHYVLVEWPYSLDEAGLPLPKQGKLHWNPNFVRLPCNSASSIQIEESTGEKLWVSRWQVIKNAYSGTITTSKELETAILSYNPKYKKIWRFKALHQLLEVELEEEESERFFRDLLPKIIELALRLPDLVQWSIPLLKQTQNAAVTLSQMQIGSLLANAFLCTFPRRNTSRTGEFSSYPDINFARLFQASGSAVMQKILCICNYFREITTCPRSGLVTFIRRFVRPELMPDWRTMEVEIGSVSLTVESSGSIEDSHGMVQADFANKYLGGGVLGHGCVQEEIRFVICPELIVSKLFMESMNDNEAVLMVGCERFSNYTGYASSFHWSGSHRDETPFDGSGRRKTCVMAIDALSFHRGAQQFKRELILRELNKAYVGFLHDLDSLPPKIASGNWGCGAFGGEPQLKSLLQLIVCAAINRPLVYYTFGNTELKEDIEKMYKFLQRNSITVSTLMTYLEAFCKRRLEPNQLFSFIFQCFYDGIETIQDSPPQAIPAAKTEPESSTQPEKISSVQRTIKSFFMCSKRKEEKQVEIDDYAEKLAQEIEKRDEALMDVVVNNLPETTTVLKPEEAAKSANERKGLSLMDALNADYYDEGPSKKLCMDIS